MYQGLESGNVRGACKYAVGPGRYLKELVRYHDELLLYGTVEDKITENVIKEAITEKDEYVAILLNNYADALRAMGQPQKAIGFIQQALDMDLQAFGDKHPDVAAFYNSIGLTWHTLGEYEKAIEFYQKALDIFTATLGDTHPNTQTAKENLENARRKLNSS
ncbi:MAG: tetratricopeptide repeat protein [Nitrospirae bacterium]|nr:tetratricopeptide repeat protein [Nitrospirota bacterium]